MSLSDSDVKTHQSHDDDEKSENTVRAWLVVLGAWFGIIAASGSRSALGTYQTYLLDHQLADMQPTFVAWIFSFYTFNSLAWGLIVGPVFDLYGSGWLLLSGSIILCLSFFLVGVCTQYWHFFLVIGLLGGTGSCLVHTTCYATIGQWFERNRATTSGFAATGSSVGGVVFILTVQSLLPKLGFGWSTRVMAFIMLAWYFVPTGYLSTYALDHGFDEAFSYQILAIFFGSAFFGRFIPGLIADRLGRFNTLIVTVIVCTVLPFALWLQVASSEALLILFAVLFGFWSACDTSLTPPCLGQLCESKDYGRYYAGAYAVSSFAPLTSLPIAGALITATGGEYWGLIIFTGLNYAVAAVCFILARGVAVGWSPKTIF